ncbi:MAG: tetratricopeptide repeat protein [Schleiferiaceae bacterium]|nr:tetratricopeptide repeat protein [Schleiferiaceae bacterium]
MKKAIVFLLLLSACLSALWQCSDTKADTEKVYLNHNDTVAYVGINTCKNCHIDKFQTFQHTGMGQSYGKADTLKSAAHFDGKKIYDPFLDFEYTPYWKGNTLYLNENRLVSGDTVHQRKEQVDYIIGSGQHTNSHLQYENGYVHQMPFTYYTQTGKLDLPPGFEDGHNSRFSRLIGLECMSCHNAMPVDFVMGSENKFEKVPLGIDCERCHGPGEAHVNKIMQGDFTDTATAIDYSIVNPKKLEKQLQFELCQRCHLQGNAVLKEGKSFFDFKPGMHLSDVMDVYLPRYSNSDEEFIMASHVDRFKQSQCFQKSDDFMCTSCHNPHISVKETNTQKFNNTCQSCHENQELKVCSESPELKAKENDNCVACHMPQSGSIDIPHVTVHDHYIRKPQAIEKTEAIKTFLGLKAINNANPSRRSQINAYLQQYERFENQTYYLDSALNLLKESANASSYLQEWVLFYHLRQDKIGLMNWLDKNYPNGALPELNQLDYQNSHAWTAYRIGEAYSDLGNPEIASAYFSKAVELAPFVQEFRVKQGNTFFALRQLDKALNAYLVVLDEQPKNEEALSNAAYVFLVKEQYEVAEKYLNKALLLNPDYKEAQLNLATLFIAQNRMAEAMELLLKMLEKYPGDEKIRAAIEYIEQAHG